MDATKLLADFRAMVNSLGKLSANEAEAFGGVEGILKLAAKTDPSRWPVKLRRAVGQTRIVVDKFNAGVEIKEMNGEEKDIRERFEKRLRAGTKGAMMQNEEN